MRGIPRDWIRVSDASELLRCSDDTIRRRIASGELTATRDPEVLRSAAGGRGRPPGMLVSVADVQQARADEVVDSMIARGPEVTHEHVKELQRQVDSLRAHLEAATQKADWWRSTARVLADAIRRLADEEEATATIVLPATEEDRQ